MGFARGGADVALVEEGPTTTLNYTVKAQVGGRMAQLGARLVDSTARQMGDQFFDRFAAQVAAAAPAGSSEGENPRPLEPELVPTPGLQPASDGLDTPAALPSPAVTPFWRRGKTLLLLAILVICALVVLAAIR